MARVPMVSRTITTTKANVMCLNVTTGEAENKVITVPRTYKDNEKLLKVLKKQEETDTLKLVHVVDVQTEETLYGMTEADFIAHAQILPPRTQANADKAE